MAEKSLVKENPISAQQKKILEGMQTETQKKAIEIRNLEIQNDKGTVVLHYQMGQLINDIRDDENTYGSKAVEQVAELLKKPPQRLYTLGNFARSVEEEFMVGWQKKSNGDGGQLSLEHWLQLSIISEQKLQDKWLTTWMKESLSAESLGDSIRSSTGGRRRRAQGGGRNFTVPKTLIGGFQKGQALLNSIFKYAPLLEKHVLQKINSSTYADLEDVVGKKDVVDKFNKDLVMTIAALQEVRNDSEKAMDRIEKAEVELASKKATEKDKKGTTPSKNGEVTSKKKKVVKPKEKGSKRPQVSTVA